MALNFIEPQKTELTPRITVFGVGGAGGNAVNNMIDQKLEGVEFVVANTDAQALQQSRAGERIQLGVKVTEGLGAGARPAVGASAAEETLEEIIDHLAGAHMCFITAGMGGGTGTGAAPIIAQAARELGVLTVGVVTKPFTFEGAKRMRQAEEGVEELQKVVDTLIIIPNQNLFRLATDRTTFTEAFALADDVLYQGVKGVTDLMVRPGMINLDFADVRAVMDEMGKAMMGTGEASGEDRARQAAEKAIANPLLDEISLNGARGVLINITGGNDLTLYELDEAANLIRDKVDPEANIIVGSTMDPEMDGAIRVSVVATGIEASADAQSLDVQRRRLAEPLAAPVVDAPAEPEAPAAAYEQPMFETQPAPQVEPQVEVAQEQRDFAPEPQAPAAAYDAQDYAPAAPVVPQPPAAPAPRAIAQDPVQDEFDLDAVLDDVPQNARQVLRVARPYPAEDTPRQPGQPSAETLERLRTAVMKTPEDVAAERHGFVSHGRQQPHQPARDSVADYEARAYEQQHRAAPQPQPQPRSVEPQAQERSRFAGFGSLINRMTGAGGDASAHEPEPRQAAPARHAAQYRQPVRSQPPVHAYEDEEQHAPAADRVEIPAFLRRQAN